MLYLGSIKSILDWLMLGMILLILGEIIVLQINLHVINTLKPLYRRCLYRWLWYGGMCGISGIIMMMPIWPTFLNIMNGMFASIFSAKLLGFAALLPYIGHVFLMVYLCGPILQICWQMHQLGVLSFEPVYPWLKPRVVALAQTEQFQFSQIISQFSCTPSCIHTAAAG